MIKNRYGFCFVFNKDGLVLVLRRSMTAKNRPGEWDLPGGIIADGEDVVLGIAREVFEETGLVARDLELVISRGGEWYGEHHEFSYHRCYVDPDKVTLSYEHDRYEWHEPLIASSMIGYKPHQLAYRHLVDSNALTVQ